MSDPATLTQAAPRGMITVRCDLAEPALRNVAVQLVGLDFPSRGRARCVAEKGLLWMSPDELLMLLPQDQVPSVLARLTGALDGVHALVADTSDARSVFHLDGPGVREVLAKVTPADMDPARLEPGVFRRTRIGQVAGAFWFRDASSAEILCFRSVATYVDTLLRNAIAGGSVGFYPPA